MRRPLMRLQAFGSLYDLPLLLVRIARRARLTSPLLLELLFRGHVISARQIGARTLALIAH